MQGARDRRGGVLPPLAEAGGRQHHPGIVAIHAVGEESGIHYIAQELVEGGRTLADRIEEIVDFMAARVLDHLGVCNAAESLVVHAAVAGELLPRVGRLESAPRERGRQARPAARSTLRPERRS